MLTNRTDLTENRDFGGGLRDMITLTGVMFDGEWLTPDEYNAVKAWENIFGIRRHENEKWKLFDPDGERFDDDDICARCGKVVNMPWERYDSLCRTCDYIVTTNNTFIPWKSGKIDDSIKQKRIKQDLFHLR